MGKKKEFPLSKEEVKDSSKSPKSWKNISDDVSIGWCYVEWWDGWRPCKVLGINKGVVVETQNGGVLEVTNLKSIHTAILIENTEHKWWN